MGDPPRIPAWVVDNALLAPGFTDESHALFRDKGLSLQRDRPVLS